MDCGIQMFISLPEVDPPQSEEDPAEDPDEDPELPPLLFLKNQPPNTPDELAVDVLDDDHDEEFFPDEDKSRLDGFLELIL